MVHWLNRAGLTLACTATSDFPTVKYLGNIEHNENYSQCVCVFD